jgi:hypothetical protein
VGARFFAAVQTGTGAYPASYTMGTGSLSGGKAARVKKKRVQLYLYSPSGPSWPVLGRTLPLTFTPVVIRFVGYFILCVAVKRTEVAGHEVQRRSFLNMKTEMSDSTKGEEFINQLK